MKRPVWILKNNNSVSYGDRSARLKELVEGGEQGWVPL